MTLARLAELKSGLWNPSVTYSADEFRELLALAEAAVKIRIAVASDDDLGEFSNRVVAILAGVDE